MSFILNNLDLDEAVFKVLEPKYPSRTTTSHFLGRGLPQRIKCSTLDNQMVQKRTTKVYLDYSSKITSNVTWKMLFSISKHYFLCLKNKHYLPLQLILDLK